MNVLNATIENTGDHLAMRIVTDEGTAFVVGPKPAILEWGVVVTGPEAWKGLFPTSTINLPPKPSDGRMDATAIEFVCQDPVVLELARRWSAGEYGDGIGPVTVPSFEEADGALWEFRGDRMRKIIG
jgi:hypothetical protein